MSPKKPSTPQTLTTTNGVTVTVNDRPPPEPRREPERPEPSPRVVIAPPEQSARDRDAFIKALDSKHGEFLRKTMVARGVLPESAKDLSQEVLLTAWTEHKKHGPPENERGWLVTMARHEVSNHKQLKKLSLQPEADATEKADSAPDPEQIATFAERRAKVDRYGRSLPIPEQQVLRCIYVLRLTLPETAKVLGRPVGTVTTQLASAKNGLDVLARASERATAAGERRRPAK